MKERLSPTPPVGVSQRRKRLAKAAAPLFVASVFLAGCGSGSESQVVGSVPDQTCPAPTATNEMYETQYADAATAEAATELRAWLQERICQKATEAARSIVEKYGENDNILLHKSAGVRDGTYDVGYRFGYDQSYAYATFGLNPTGGPDFSNLLSVSTMDKISEEANDVGAEHFSANKINGQWSFDYSKTYDDANNPGNESFHATSSLTNLPLHATMADIARYREETAAHTTMLAIV